MITKIIIGVLCVLVVAVVIWAVQFIEDDDLAQWLGDDD